MSDQLEQRLRDFLSVEAERVEADRSKASPIARRARRWRAAVAGGSLVLLVAGGVGASSLIEADRDLQPAPSSENQAPVVATIQVGRTYGLGVGPDGVWSANYEDGEVVFIDTNSNEVTQRVEVGATLGAGASSIFASGDDVWVVASDNLVVGHLDPDTLVLEAAVDAGSSGIADVAIDTEGDLWVLQNSGPRTFETVEAFGQRIHPVDRYFGEASGYMSAVFSDIAAGDGGVWVLDESAGVLARVRRDGTSEAVLTSSELLTGGAADLLVAHGYVWIATTDEGTDLARFDPKTGDMVLVGTFDGRGTAMASAADGIWLLTEGNEEGRLWKVGVESLLSDKEPYVLDGDFRLSDMVYTEGSLWISHDYDRLTRVAVDSEAETGESPTALEERGDSSLCDDIGPWIDCPEANWLRRVIGEAGFEVVDDSADSYLIKAGPYEVHAWNAAAETPIALWAEEAGYSPRQGTDAFTDGTRVVWQEGNIYFFISTFPEESIGEVPTQVIDRLIAASRVVPREADLSDAKPLPEPTTTDQSSEQLPDGTYRVSPTSADVPNEGKYLFSAPHCGLGHVIDFDGSFWEAEKPEDYEENPDAYSFFYNSDNGTITFESDDEAVYQASTGELIPLERLPGPIAIDGCA